MKYLLDSNVLLWALTDRARLPAKIMSILNDGSTEIFVSTASLWELSIKVAKGKLPMPGSSVLHLMYELEKTRTKTLSITYAHILRTESLPHHHGDPFDRMIIAQALEENLTILTSDSDIPKYAAPVVWK